MGAIKLPYRFLCSIHKNITESATTNIAAFSSCLSGTITLASINANSEKNPFHCISLPTTLLKNSVVPIIDLI